MKNNSEKFVKKLENNYISSITFMNGYMAIGFNIGALTANIPPSILKEKKLWRWEEPGYNDLMISLVETKVISVILNENEEFLNLILENDVELLISWNDYTLEVPEAFILNIDSEVLIM